jgi:hypothetical protein
MLVFVWITRTVEGGTGFRQFVKKRVDAQKKFLKKVGNAVLTKKQMNDIKNSKRKQIKKKKKQDCKREWNKCKDKAEKKGSKDKKQQAKTVCHQDRRECMHQT